jgi:tRNA threonylcarbamoyladenosine biosynthesis protein TsaB
MMRTIAIDTSHAGGTVAALAGPSVATRTLGVAGEHATRIAVALENAVDDLGWRLADTELVVVVRGPGPFTGLRVGVAAAKSIAWTSGAKLVGVCGFEVIAREAGGVMSQDAASIHIAFDAGRGEVYAATATPCDSPSRWAIGPPSLLAATDWLDALPPRSIVSGPAVATLAGALTSAAHRVAAPDAWFPTAVAAAQVGIMRAAANQLDDPAALVPHYLRLSYAEERS